MEASIEPKKNQQTNKTHNFFLSLFSFRFVLLICCSRCFCKCFTFLVEFVCWNVRCLFFPFFSTTTSENWDEHHEAKQRTHALLMRIPFGLNGNGKKFGEWSNNRSRPIHSWMYQSFVFRCITVCAVSLSLSFFACQMNVAFRLWRLAC